MNKKSIAQLNMLVAWLIALVAMIGSLYASEILKMPVCHLCWYQRIAMYPLVLILGIASYRNEIRIIPYIIGLPIIGALFALYHYLEQMIPGFAPIELCGTGISCSTIDFQWLGFITFPMLSLFTNLTITALLFIAWKFE